MQNGDMQLLQRFSASSKNDEMYRHLWVKGASLFVPQLNQLLKHTDYEFVITDVNEFNNENAGKLGSLLAKHKSDKSTTHNYNIVYSYIFNKLGSTLNLFEVGLGTNNPNLVSTMGRNARPGASLYAFKEYLPNANIYGADVDKQILFESDGIKTCFVDQLDSNTFENVKTSFGNIKFDVIIDDGLHAIGANFNTLLFALDNIADNGWIVIEDINIQRSDSWKSIDYILQQTKKYKTYMIKTRACYMYLVNKL